MFKYISVCRSKKLKLVAKFDKAGLTLIFTQECYCFFYTYIVFIVYLSRGQYY